MNNKKPAICIVPVCLLLSSALLIRPITAEEPSYQNITVQQAKQLIDQNIENMVILDVRNQSEYDLGHLFDAVLIPVYAIENSTIPIELPPPPTDNSLLMDVYMRAESAFRLADHINDTIIVYCAAGPRSAQACQILIDHGYTEVHNLIGGINAWMDAGLSIYTSNHHITVGINNGQPVLDIQPLLQYRANCIPYQNQSEPSSNITIPSIEVTQTILEESENRTLVLVSEEIDGVVTEYTVEKTLLWGRTESKQNFNRTTTLTSILHTIDNNSTQIFRLYNNVQHRDYNMTFYTILSPLDAETYNTSVTVMSFVP